MLPEQLIFLTFFLTNDCFLLKNIAYIRIFSIGVFSHLCLLKIVLLGGLYEIKGYCDICVDDTVCLIPLFCLLSHRI